MCLSLTANCVFDDRFRWLSAAKSVSRISFIGFRKQVAGRARQEKCVDSANKFMEKCKLYLDYSMDLCYDNTIDNYGRMKNAPT
jgi:hypothetical protein